MGLATSLDMSSLLQKFRSSKPRSNAKETLDASLAKPTKPTRSPVDSDAPLDSSQTTQHKSSKDARTPSARLAARAAAAGESSAASRSARRQPVKGRAAPAAFRERGTAKPAPAAAKPSRIEPRDPQITHFLQFSSVFSKLPHGKDASSSEKILPAVARLFNCTGLNQQEFQIPRNLREHHLWYKIAYLPVPDKASLLRIHH